MAHLTDIDVTAPADSLFSGGTVLNTWRTRIDALNDVLGDITAAEANQVENIAATTISAAQWGYLGACVAGGGQLLAALTAAESTQLEAIGTTTISAAQWGYLGACGAGGGQLLAALTASESTQLEAIGAVTITNTQWGYLGALNQGLTITSTVTFGTINAFTLGGKLTAGAVEIEGSAFDINGGTVDGITSLTAAGDLYIGAYGFRAATLIADSLTATRVIFTGDNGLLRDDADFTFVTDTLTVTKIGAFQATGAINFDSQNMTNVDIDSGTIDGITDLAVADGGTGSSTAANARTALGLVIGTNVLAQQTIGIADDNLLEVDDTDAASTDYARFTAAGLQGRDATEVKTDLGLVIGTNVLAFDTGLSNLAGISMAADKFYYTSGDNTHIAATVTSFARTILDDANAATVLGTLGLSTNLPNLADAEVTQLEAIGDVTVSYAQWGYLGAMSYGVAIGSAPAFLVFKNSADQDDIAINEDVTVTFAGEIYDIGGNFATNTFTAPVTGKYYLDACVRLEDLDQAATFYAVKIITGNRTYSTYINMSQFAADVPYWSLNLSVCADMDADDTAHVAVYQSGGAVQTDFFGHATVLTTYFSGVLVA